MPRALVDTSVLYAAAYQRDRHHERALPILRGIDSGDLPEAVILDYVLAETLNGLTTNAGHDAAVDFLDRLEENQRFHVESLSAAGFARAKSLFRKRRKLSLVDASLAAYADEGETTYLYAFDDDFDSVDRLSRLETPTNPYAPD